jgi:hypothetical protein
VWLFQWFCGKFWRLPFKPILVMSCHLWGHSQIYACRVREAGELLSSEELERTSLNRLEKIDALWCTTCSDSTLPYCSYVVDPIRFSFACLVLARAKMRCSFAFERTSVLDIQAYWVCVCVEISAWGGLYDILTLKVCQVNRRTCLWPQNQSLHIDRPWGPLVRLHLQIHQILTAIHLVHKSTAEWQTGRHAQMGKQDQTSRQRQPLILKPFKNSDIQGGIHTCAFTHATTIIRYDDDIWWYNTQIECAHTYTIMNPCLNTNTQSCQYRTDTATCSQDT